MWLPIVPLLVIGFFLLITWDALSPVKYIKQSIAIRKQRKKEFEDLDRDEE